MYLKVFDQILLGIAFESTAGDSRFGFILKKRMVEHIKSCDLKSPLITILTLKLLGRCAVKNTKALASARNSSQTTKEAE